MTTLDIKIINGLVALVADLPTATRADIEALQLEVDMIARNAAEDTREVMDSFSSSIERTTEQSRRGLVS